MRRGNILEGKNEKKGKETFYREEGRKENKKGRKKRKEQEKGREKKACGRSCSDVAGCGGLSFCYSRGLAYQGIIGGIACGVQVNGRGLVLISMKVPHWYLHN